eukprot:TRINITY_DN37393_c0_g1_i1.p1 TRINITY_DN37393_c0_g1~~TRINITY_DN37393_c0_g1_i1.p1  ORF type:complete len:427 (-),score=76.86 TRINITY_DN37393_c0_g1_i1:91-1371(-)
MDLHGFYEGLGMLVLSMYMFLGISVLCDEHLCPSLDKLCDHLRLPTALAAATFVSFGSSAPELIISTLGAARNKTELSVPAVLISALIAFAAIPPMVVKAAGPMQLHVREVARDAFAYFLTLLLFVYMNNQDEISAYHAFLLVGSYFFYLLVVWISSASDDDEAGEECEGTNGDSASSQLHMWVRFCCRRSTSGDRANGQLADPLLTNSANGDVDSSASENEDAPGPIMACLQKPFELMFEKTVPNGAISGFGSSMAWLCVLSYLAMLCAEKVVDYWSINPAVAGVTLLAWGGQLPDTIAAVALAKCGKPDEAISQAISSQVINVSLGLGAPFLVYSFATGLPTVTQQRHTVEFVGLMVALSICAYFLTMAPGTRLFREWMKSSERWSAEINNSRAMFLLVSFFVLYAASIATCQFGVEGISQIFS